jgi:hypothetical protein
MKLTWKVTKTVPTACPDYVPDPYTGAYPSFHCAVYHCTTIIEEMVKDFATKEEAFSFAAKAPSSCTDFMLNGVAIEDTRPKIDELIVIAGDIVGTGTTTISDTATLIADGSSVIRWNET